MKKDKIGYNMDKLQQDVKQIKQGMYFILNKIAGCEIENILKLESDVNEAHKMYDAALNRKDTVDIIKHLKNKSERLDRLYNELTKEYGKLNNLLAELRLDYDNN